MPSATMRYAITVSTIHDPSRPAMRYAITVTTIPYSHPSLLPHLVVLSLPLPLHSQHVVLCYQLLMRYAITVSMMSYAFSR